MFLSFSATAKLKLQPERQFECKFEQQFQGKFKTGSYTNFSGWKWIKVLSGYSQVSSKMTDLIEPTLYF